MSCERIITLLLMLFVVLLLLLSRVDADETLRTCAIDSFCHGDLEYKKNDAINIGNVNASMFIGAMKVEEYRVLMRPIIRQICKAHHNRKLCHKTEVGRVFNETLVRVLENHGRMNAFQKRIAKRPMKKVRELFTIINSGKKFVGKNEHLKEYTFVSFEKKERTNFTVLQYDNERVTCTSKMNVHQLNRFMSAVLFSLMDPDYIPVCDEDYSEICSCILEEMEKINVIESDAWIQLYFKNIIYKQVFQRLLRYISNRTHDISRLFCNIKDIHKFAECLTYDRCDEDHLAGEKNFAFSMILYNLIRL